MKHEPSDPCPGGGDLGLSTKAEAKLFKALDYLVAINDNCDNPAQKWVVNESILASLTGCFRPAIKKFVEAQKRALDGRIGVEG